MQLDRRAAIKAFAAAAGTGFITRQPAAAAAGAPDAFPSHLSVLSEGTAPHRYEAHLGELTRYVEAHVREYRLPGMTFAATDRDGFTVIVTAGWARIAEREPVRPEHLFQIGSISKSLAAICILRAAAEGKFKMDDALGSLLPELPLPSERITVRQLLSHTTGLPDDAPPFPLGGNGRLWTGYAPGSRFSYSNTGYELVGHLLERVHDRPYDEIVRSVVLAPLGMSHSKGSIRVADQNAYARGHCPYYLDRPYVQGGLLGPAYFTEFTRASGCIASTPEDMARYLRYLIAAGGGKGAPLLADADAEQFTTPVTDAPVFGPTAKYALGLGVVPVNGVSCLHHTGGMTSFSSSIHVDPETGVAAFASTNTSAGGYRPRSITYFACELMRAVREGAAIPAPPDIVSPERIADAGRFAGAYRSDAGTTLTLRAQGPGLVTSIDARELRLQRIDDEAFIIPHPRFERMALSFENEAGARIAWWGEERFARQGAGQRSAAPAAQQRDKAGYYTNLDPWEGSLHVFIRGESLWLDDKRLVPLPDGSFRVGDDPAGCERVRFEAKLNGRFQHLLFSGVLFRRDSSDVKSIA